jgi:lantibiotic biosynthesis dehydratase-like protein
VDALDLEARLDAEVPLLTEALHAVAGEPPAGDAERGRQRLSVVTLRRALHNRRQVSAVQLDSVRGLLPPTLFASVAEHVSRRAELLALLAGCDRAYRRELLRARRSLLSLAARPVFRLGIRLVSRALLERLRAMTATAAMDPDRWRHDERHAAAKLAAYAARFAVKTSPNSVFTATALAWIAGGQTRVRGANQPAKSDVLLSVAEARKISACIGSDRAAWPAIVPRPNPTLRRQDGSWLFWRPSSLRREDDDEVLSRTREQPILDLFFEETGRALPTPKLLAAVAARYEVEVEELAPFYERLVDQGILIAELEPPYNSRRPLLFVAEAMRSAGCEAPWLPEIEKVESEVDTLATRDPDERIAAMDALQERLSALPHARRLKGDELFRVDVAAGVEVTLPERVRADLEAPLRRYVRLFAALYPERAFRAGWARRYLARHPADADVPLLDLYHGLFEPEPEQRPESFPDAPPDSSATFERTRDFFASRAASEAGQEEVILTDEDWDALAADLPEPPWSAGALFQIAAQSPEQIAAGRYRMVLNALFGAGIALARFAHLLGGLAADKADNPVAREVARSWEPLAREGAILAEVTYNQLGRTANAGLRPALFRHEIELLGDRASPTAEVIPLREMTVRWDSTENRFVLRWVSRAVEVVPVISSGVSPQGFVSFLVEIGRQGLQPLAIFPGFDVAGIARWPRFTAGRLVLFRRRWIFAPGEAPQPMQEGKDPDAAGGRFFAATVRWRHRYGLPRHVFLHTPAEPKPFYADLDSPLFVDLLRRLLSPMAAAEGPPTLHVTEMLPGPDEMWVADERGRYATEFLLHLRGPA